MKTTVLLPADLWEAAKIWALKERTDLRSLIIGGIEAQLKGPLNLPSSPKPYELGQKEEDAEETLIS